MEQVKYNSQLKELVYNEFPSLSAIPANHQLLYHIETFLWEQLNNPSSIIDSQCPLYLRTADHPEANGRTPQKGESKWTLDFNLEDGRRLFLEMGKEQHDRWVEFCGMERNDDAVELNKLRADLEKAEAHADQKTSKLLAIGVCANGCGMMIDDGDGDSHCPVCEFTYGQRSLYVRDTAEKAK